MRYILFSLLLTISACSAAPKLKYAYNCREFQSKSLKVRAVFLGVDGSDSKAISAVVKTVDDPVTSTGTISIKPYIDVQAGMALYRLLLLAELTQNTIVVELCSDDNQVQGMHMDPW
ncbi:hypothetical protein [Caballeronia sp. LZ001]|uniref:hypothetical protein n=1 Tax=Caballeronia sp. LZ001 TaxID=3038553 RepID=UPI00286165F1|nr:hypothetical protein [Caballeronia sp. LZ001]MDR5805484.1 hypothetical protein [Caballeronia sp. LZ001]